MDRSTGATISETRAIAINAPSRGMYKAPGFIYDSGFGQPQNDLALIKLQTPFTLSKYIQTAGLPSLPSNPGRSGVLPTHVHTSLPAGYTSIVRAQEVACSAPSGFFCINPPAGSMCHGDSGSGFVEQLAGRATVVGITSNISGGEACVAAGGQAQFADVFAPAPRAAPKTSHRLQNPTSIVGPPPLRTLAQASWSTPVCSAAATAAWWAR